MSNRPRKSLAERLAIASRDPDGCWEHVGVLDGKGYGIITMPNGKRGGDKVRVHRAVYEFMIGPIPSGMQLDHLCRNRRCFNPRHLEPVTSLENSRRGISFSAQNAAKTHCAHGHPLAGDNVKWHTRDGRLTRICMTCKRANNAALTAARSAARATASAGRPIDPHRDPVTGRVLPGNSMRKVSLSR